jgi:hypothetical protein
MLKFLIALALLYWGGTQVASYGLRALPVIAILAGLFALSIGFGDMLKRSPIDDFDRKHRI